MYGTHPSLETRKLQRENHANVSEKNNPRFGTKLSNASSSYFGVSIHKQTGYWQSSVGKHYTGLFKTEIEAAIAHDKYVIANNLFYPVNFLEENENEINKILI